MILEGQRQQLEHIRGRGMGEAQRELALPARGLELGVAGPQRCRELGRLGERGGGAAREPLGARGRRAVGGDREHQRDAVARLREDHRDAAGAGVGEQPSAVLAERLEHELPPLGGSEQREGGGVHRRALERRPGLFQAELVAQIVEDVVADGGDDLGPVEQAAGVDCSARLVT